jgi:single-strand DNA-binding protein
MNSLKNSVRLIGNLGANPEIKTFEKGTKCAKFSLATDDTYTDREGKKVTDTQWHHVIAWGKTADIIEEFLSKGSEVAIEGRLTTKSYDGKDGEKKYFTEIILNDLLMLGKKSQN